MTSSLAVTNIANLIRRRISDQTKQQQLIDELFGTADLNNDGHIQFVEYQRIFHKYSIDLTHDEMRMLFMMADKNKDSKISPHELRNNIDDKIIKSKSQTAFKAYDQNHDGVVTKGEMKLMSGGRLSKEQIDACFDKNDKNKDGVLSKAEIEQMMRNRYEQQPAGASAASTPPARADKKKSKPRPRH